MRRTHPNPEVRTSGLGDVKANWRGTGAVYNPGLIQDAMLPRTNTMGSGYFKRGGKGLYMDRIYNGYDLYVVKPQDPVGPTLRMLKEDTSVDEGEVEFPQDTPVELLQESNGIAQVIIRDTYKRHDDLGLNTPSSNLREPTEDEIASYIMGLHPVEVPLYHVLHDEDFLINDWKQKVLSVLKVPPDSEFDLIVDGKKLYDIQPEDMFVNLLGKTLELKIRGHSYVINEGYPILQIKQHFDHEEQTEASTWWGRAGLALGTVVGIALVGLVTGKI